MTINPQIKTDNLKPRTHPMDQITAVHGNIIRTTTIVLRLDCRRKRRRRSYRLSWQVR